MQWRATEPLNCFRLTRFQYPRFEAHRVSNMRNAVRSVSREPSRVYLEAEPDIVPVWRLTIPSVKAPAARNRSLGQDDPSCRCSLALQTIQPRLSHSQGYVGGHVEMPKPKPLFLSEAVFFLPRYQGTRADNRICRTAITSPMMIYASKRC